MHQSHGGPLESGCGSLLLQSLEDPGIAYPAAVGGEGGRGGRGGRKERGRREEERKEEERMGRMKKEEEGGKERGREGE